LGHTTLNCLLGQFPHWQGLCWDLLLLLQLFWEFLVFSWSVVSAATGVYSRGKELGNSAVSSVCTDFNCKLESRAIYLSLSASEFIWFKNNKSWDGGQLPFHANQCHGFNLIILVLWKLLLTCCNMLSSFSAWPLDAPKSMWKLKGRRDRREMFIINSTRIFTFYQCWLCKSFTF